jgi:hypothetical protein
MSLLLLFLHHFALAYLMHCTMLLLAHVAHLSARPHIHRVRIGGSSGASSSQRPLQGAHQFELSRLSDMSNRLACDCQHTVN